MNIDSNYPQVDKENQSNYQTMIGKVRLLPPRKLIALSMLLLMLPLVITAVLHQAFISSKAWQPNTQLVTAQTEKVTIDESRESDQSPGVETENKQAVPVVQNISAHGPADINSDGKIDILDYSLLIKEYSQSNNEDLNYRADLDQDNKVTMDDINYFFQLFNQ